MKAIQDAAAFFFVAAVMILSVISVLGVWDFFAHDVISKSFQTLGLLAVVSVVVIVAGRYIDARHSGQGAPAYVPNPAFSMLRKLTLAILIMLAAVLALLGVMAIWDFIADKAVLWKSIGSLAVLAFGAFIIVLTCSEREKLPTVNADGTTSSAGSTGMVSIILALLVAGWFIMTALGGII
ncbi:MAG TPA: hypothetical protein VGP13_01790 [Candidatus Paceibacterota bacterium]|jgi:hypothetical protein|nr:hypothetical protein [Candidatus Paceibacterota bacterium]